MHGVGHELLASTNSIGMAFFVVSNGLTLEHMLDRTLMSEAGCSNHSAKFLRLYDRRTRGHRQEGK